MAKGKEREIQIGLDAGAEKYLLKPFVPDQLTDQVKSILAKFGKGGPSTWGEPLRTEQHSGKSTLPYCCQ